jgi:hypothetical protein
VESTFDKRHQPHGLEFGRLAPFQLLQSVYSRNLQMQEVSRRKRECATRLDCITCAFIIDAWFGTPVNEGEAQSAWNWRPSERVKQTGVLRRFTDRLPTKARTDSTHEQPKNTGE